MTKKAASKPVVPKPVVDKPVVAPPVGNEGANEGANAESAPTLPAVDGENSTNDTIPTISPDSEGDTPPAQPEVDPAYVVWLEKVAECLPMDDQGPTVDGAEPIKGWFTQENGLYLGRTTDDFKWLYDVGVSEQFGGQRPDSTVVQVGFNPQTAMYYGINKGGYKGFTVGHQVSSTDPEYQPHVLSSWLNHMVNRHTTKGRFNVNLQADVAVGGEEGALLTWDQERDPESLEANQFGHGQAFVPYPSSYGRGAWTARTLADARQMAIDFARVDS